LTGFAIALVLASAFLHATWNLLTKQANGGTAFVWLISVFSGIFLIPAAAYILVVEKPTLGAEALAFIALSSALHVAYYLALNRAYRAGDLSLVYPLARGGAPVLSTIGAIILLGERPTIIALLGAVLISVGAFILMGNPLKIRGSAASGAIGYGLMTAAIVAAYTLSDKQAVGPLMVSPLLLIFVSSIVRVVVLLPVGLRQAEQVRHVWGNHWRSVLSVALLDPLSYTLFLIALAFSPVSYIAPVRQVSVLIGAFLGVRLLAEGDARRRLLAAGVMMAGLVALALG
jgi:uncharacterized membrane protein